MNTTTLTLTGYLGRDREIRYTRLWNHEVPGRVVSDEEHEYIVPPTETQSGGREFIVLSLATNTRTPKGWQTHWHRLVAWDTDRGALGPVHLCRKGMKIQVTGYKHSFTTYNGRVIEQLVVQDLKILDIRAPKLP